MCISLIPAPSSPPTNITVLHTNSTSFTLSWLPPPPEDHNGDIIEYQVTITRLSTLVSTTLITNATQLVVARLVPYNGYEVTMAAFTSEGSGPHTEPLFLQTEQDGKASHKYILLNWIKPACNGGTIACKFNLSYSRNSK